MIDNLMAARMQMGISLGFHIIFASIGMVMPFFMATSEYLWIKTKNPEYLTLTKAWSKGVAIMFAVGAVSGTLLSFELGLLWPEFMKYAGSIIGLPFSLEGTFFFLEAIFLGLFLYGWDKMPKTLHWFFGLCVGLMGLCSGIIVVAANGWMNSPSGFDWVNGEAINIDPVKALLNKAWGLQALHMVLAGVMSTGFAVAGVHALILLKNPSSGIHRKALKISLAFAVVTSLLQPLSGDLSAKAITKRQPEKLAAMEALFHTEKPAPLLIGGIVNEKEQTVKYGIKVPRALSFLAHGNFEAEVKGLNEFPKENHPPVAVTHYAFQIMVGIGSLLMMVSLLYLVLGRKLNLLSKNWFLLLLGILTPTGFIALEAGWVVTEVGRQPWIIYKVMRTAEAVTPMPGMVYKMYLFVGIYIFLSIVVTTLMGRQILSLNKKENA